MKVELCILSLFWILNSQAQTIVIHQDLLKQQAKNDAVQAGMQTTYISTISEVKKSKSNNMDANGAIEMVQEKVFNSLTNVSDGLKNIKTLIYISRYSLSTLDNVAKAISLSAGKPYLINLVAKDAELISGRLVNLNSFITNFILNENKDQLLKPTERDRLLYNVYRQMMVLDAISSNLCDRLKKWTLEDNVNHIIPFKHWINNDTRILNNILNTWKY